MAILNNTTVSGSLTVTGNIKENGTLLVNKYLGLSATAVNSDKLDGNASSYYLDYNNFINTPDIPTAYLSSVSYNSGTRVLTITPNTGDATSLTFGSNAFTSTTIPTTYIKSASTNNNTLTLTPASGNNVVFTPTFTEQHVGDVVSVGATSGSHITIGGTSANPTVGIESDYSIPSNSAQATWNSKVTGPDNSTSHHIPTFDDNTGNTISDSGVSLTYVEPVTNVKLFQFDLTHSNNDYGFGFQYNGTASTPYGIFYPTNGPCDIGLNTNQWRDIYFSGSLSDGTNSISVANIANKNNVITGVSVNGTSVATSGVADITSVPWSIISSKPTIPATNVIPATTTANKVLLSTTTSGTAAWSSWSSAGFLKTNTSGVVSVDTTSYIPTTLSTSNNQRYLVGSSTTTSASLNTNSSCYMLNGELYSNSKNVAHWHNYLNYNSFPAAPASLGGSTVLRAYAALGCSTTNKFVILYGYIPTTQKTTTVSFFVSSAGGTSKKFTNIPFVITSNYSATDAQTQRTIPTNITKTGFTCGHNTGQAVAWIALGFTTDILTN